LESRSLCFARHSADPDCQNAFCSEVAMLAQELSCSEGQGQSVVAEGAQNNTKLLLACDHLGVPQDVGLNPEEKDEKLLPHTCIVVTGCRTIHANFC